MDRGARPEHAELWFCSPAARRRGSRSGGFALAYEPNAGILRQILVEMPIAGLVSGEPRGVPFGNNQPRFRHEPIRETTDGIYRNRHSR